MPCSKGGVIRSLNFGTNLTFKIFYVYRKSMYFVLHVCLTKLDQKEKLGLLTAKQVCGVLYLLLLIAAMTKSPVFAG